MAMSNDERQEQGQQDADVGVVLHHIARKPVGEGTCAGGCEQKVPGGDEKAQRIAHVGVGPLNRAEKVLWAKQLEADRIGSQYPENDNSACETEHGVFDTRPDLVRAQPNRHADEEESDECGTDHHLFADKKLGHATQAEQEAG
jgi:hypothetical protein